MQVLMIAFEYNANRVANACDTTNYSTFDTWGCFSFVILLFLFAATTAQSSALRATLHIFFSSFVVVVVAFGLN